MRRSGVLLGAAAAVTAMALPGTAWAQSETRLSADVSATAGYANNPFTVTGDDTGAAVVSLDFAPRWQLLSARSTVTLSADINAQQYLRRYGDNESYAAALDYQGRPSEQLTTHLRLDLSSSVLGAFDRYQPFATGFGSLQDPAVTAPAGAGTAGAAPVLPADSVSPLVPITDIGLFGLRNRRRQALLSGDFTLGLSARDSLTGSAYGEAARYSGFGTADFDAYGGSAGWSHRLSARSTVGLTGSVGLNHYRVGNADSRIYSVQATGSTQLSERWSASGALGVSFVDSDTSRSTSSTSLSGNLDLCRRGEATSTCLQVARQVSPTGFAGSQYVTSAGLSWTKRLDERQNLSLGANYSRVNGNNIGFIGSGLPVQTDYVQASIGYDRRIAERLRFVASTNYRQLLGDNTGRPKDFGGQIGVAYRLGDRR